MRFSMTLLTSAAALAAAAAIAQTPPADAPADQPAEAPRGLQDLEDTVDQLIDEEPTPTAPERATPRLEETQPLELDETPLVPARETEPPAETVAPRAAAPEPAPAQAEAAPEAPLPSRAVGSPPPPPLSSADRVAVDRAAERGRLLIAIARAGILATQDMLTRISDPDGAGIIGWIAEPAGSAMEVSFYANGAGGPHTAYRATVNGARVVGREIFLGADRPAFNPLQARMAAARAVAEGLENRPCGSDSFNFLVVPPTNAEAPVDVYETSPPTRAGHFPLGGHFRATIAADGSVVESRGFTNACLDLPVQPAAAGAQPRPIGVTHLLDRTPTEIHVFLSQMIGRPLLVATGDPQRIWLVTPERIAEVRN